jgi:uncharacterized glyoxalase superfamily protein PhnB
MSDQVPPDQYHKIAYAHLKNNAIEFSATDWMHRTRAPRQGNMVAIYLNGGTHTELRKIFEQLRDGADDNHLDELSEMPFGTYGHLADRFGVHWFFQGESAG